MRRIIVLIVSLMASLSHANTGTYTKSPRNRLSASEERALDAALRESEKLLPAKLRSALQNRIGSVEIVVRPSLGTGPVDLAALCPYESLARAKTFEEQILARTFSNNPKKIEISGILLGMITAGRAGARKYPCGHGDTYTKAIATLLHETVHLYDFLNVRPQSELNAIQRCKQARLPHNPKISAPRRPLDPECAELLKLETTVSSEPYFKSLAGWFHTGTLINVRKNGNLDREWSADPYEFASLRENLAVNFEFFLLDPDFQCRAWAMNRYFEKIFGHRAFARSECLDTQVEIDVGTLSNPEKQVVSVDPKRVYEIHYIRGDKGKRIQSAWGHSMYRIVMCAPFRREVSAACLKDLEHHLIVAFRADLGAQTLDPLKGLLGKYPSKLFLDPFKKIYRDYTWEDLRTMRIYPMKLSAVERETFIRSTLQFVRGYKGRYYFMSNNCAHGALNVMKMVLPDRDFQEMATAFPNSVYKIFAGEKLLDLSVVNDRGTALKEGYLFESMDIRIDEVLAELRQRYGRAEFSEFQDFVYQTTAASRRALYLSVIRSTPADHKLPAKFVFIEDYIEFALQQLLQKDRIDLFKKRYPRVTELDSQTVDRFMAETELHFANQIQEIGRSVDNFDFFKSEIVRILRQAH